MRAHGVVLALERDAPFGDALLRDGDASRYDLECGMAPLAPHALRAIASMRRHRCEKITVVCAGDAHASVARERIERWRGEPSSALREAPTIDVVAADEGTDTARALAACERFADETTTTLLVVQGDVVTDVALDDVLSTHLVNAATATCALAKKRAWAEVETKAGRAPKGMRYVGLNADETRVVFLAGGEHDEAKKRLKLQRSALNATAEMVIRTDVIDVGIYALEARETFAALREKTHLKSLRFDLVPHFAAEQFRGTTAGGVAAYMVKPDKYCVAVDTAKPALLEASREIAAEFHHLLERPLSKYDNVVDPSTVIGAKSTIGPGCAVAGQCTFKDKCSVKKSVVAADCVFGSGVKISNSLILRGAVVHDGAQIQGCIVGPGAVIGARVTAKDSIIGAAYEVEEDADLDAETVVVQNK